MFLTPTYLKSFREVGMDTFSQQKENDHWDVYEKYHFYHFNCSILISKYSTCLLQNIWEKIFFKRNTTHNISTQNLNILSIFLYTPFKIKLPQKSRKHSFKNLHIPFIQIHQLFPFCPIIIHSDSLFLCLNH